MSNNCWGAGLYHERGCRYNTPTIGLWIPADDYLALLAHFREALTQPLTFQPHAPYPLGILGDGITVHFQHYATEEDARLKWQRRAARLPARDDALIVKICDRDGFEARHLDLFDALPFRHKVAFLTKGRFDVRRFAWAIELDSTEGTVADGQRLWDMTRDLAAFDTLAGLR